MMAVARTKREPVDYVLLADRELPQEERTVWKLRPLSAVERADIDDHMGSIDPETGTFVAHTGTMILKALVVGLVGVDNLLDEDGGVVEFSDYPKPKRTGKGISSVKTNWPFLDLLDADIRRELAGEIMQGSFLTSDDVGKSE
jgi:hypothetical protein